MLLDWLGRREGDERLVEAGDRGRVELSNALAVLATREKYLALEEHARRYDVGVKYGLLTAQLALALSGQDRDDVLTRLLELLAALSHQTHFSVGCYCQDETHCHRSVPKKLLQAKGAEIL